MTTEALAGWSDRFAIVACLHVSPVGVQPMFPGFTHFVLISLELSFGHHLATISVAYDAIVFDVRLHVSGGFVLDDQSLHHFYNLKFDLNLRRGFGVLGRC